MTAPLVRGLPLDFNAHRFGFCHHLELFDAHARHAHPRIGQAEVGYAVCKRLDKIEMPAGEDVLDAIDNGTLIRTDTGVSTRAIEQWDEKAAADKTWPNFQTHFETANLRRLEDLTAADAGLGGAHAANAAVTAPPTTPIASILPLKPLPPTLLTVAVIAGRTDSATTPITPA